MRGIFFALLLCNLLTYLWGLVVGSDDVPARPKSSKANPYTHIPELVLLDEIKLEDSEAKVNRLYTKEVRNKALGEKANSQAGEGVSTMQHEGKALCELVGPFAEKEIAREFIEKLTGVEVKSSVKDIELPSGRGYWVYLEPAENRKQALRRLGELQSKGVDSYVIPKGELEHGISLGMFSQKDLADSRLKEMVKIGLQPKIMEIERSYREIWVMLDKGEDAKLNKYTWDRLLEGTNMLERRQNYCLDVASK